MFFDLSIPLKFDGPQPNAYGVDPAAAKPLGDTRTGSSVNFGQYTFTPHCNGTHTECVGHITHERISVRDRLKDVILPAVLVSVDPEYVDGERQITSASLLDFIKEFGAESTGSVSKALIVRTLPNDPQKLTAVYNEGSIPPFFTAEAIRLIVDSGFAHLLCDLPSIDRIYDDGKLINHRMFWNVEEGSFETGPGTRMDSTITELIFVPNEIPDGEYTLNLQIAPFDADCAPSRPLLLIE
ncbi:MAG TPA: cyclase family protein [Pyrinomonadaceae bacterium]|nr:cyclase family protein [Pyrinomonadaceae bacterium]